MTGITDEDMNLESSESSSKVLLSTRVGMGSIYQATITIS